LEKLRHKIAAATAGLSAEQRARHRPGKWSAAEILEHLYLTYTGTIKGFERVLEANRPLAAVPTWRQSARKFVVVGLGHMPEGREAPPVARPRGLPPEKVLAEIIPKIEEMDAIIRRCEEKIGLGKLLDHPILGPLTGDQWRKFHLVHGLHHLRQIERLRQSFA
jgi:uncharacterized protein DUF1569